jgi:tRNA-specific 2-thiouridylase
LGLAGGGEPRYAVSVDRAAATVTVGSRVDLLTSATEVGALEWAHLPVAGGVTVQCSAHGSPAAAVLDARADGSVTVRWEEPHERVAPGQSVVFYGDDEVLGGGTAR